MNYYNDNDPFAASMVAQLWYPLDTLPPGDVDDRSILEVSADDLKG